MIASGAFPFSVEQLLQIGALVGWRPAPAQSVS
jgi:hypothetical protein